MVQALPPPDPPTAAIVVTGSALPEPAASRAYAVEQIGRRRIEQSPSRDLDQLLKEVPGLQLFRRSDARSGHPTGQGVTLRSLGGNASSRAQLLLDGVPQADPFGGWINWPAYDPMFLDQVRVVRGGGSVAGGPGALAGLIDMASRTDRGFGAELSAGSRGSLEARGRAGVPIGASLLSLGGSVERGGGFVPVTQETRGPADERAPYRSWTGRGRWVAAISPQTELQASASAFRDSRTRGVDFSGNRTTGADASLRLVSRGPLQWSALGYWQKRDFSSSFASVSAGRLSATRASLQDSVPSHALGGALELRPPMGRSVELRIGADVRRTEGETRELFAYVANEPTRRRVAGGETWTAGTFAEAALSLDRLTVTGGGRVDFWRIAEGMLAEKLIASGSVLRDERFAARSGWLPTGHAGLRAEVARGIAVRSAAYLGWRMPTLNELFRPFRAGPDATAANAQLEPERLAGLEAGIDARRGPVGLAATVFTNRLTNAIANVTLAQGPGLFPGVGFVSASGTYRQRQNLEAIRARGLEASVDWSRGPWSARGGISLTDASVEASGAAAPLDGLRPAQTPRFAATLGLGWASGGRSVQLVLRHVGAQYEDDLNLRILKEATTLDAALAWPLAKSAQLVLRAENLLDALVPAALNGDGSIERATPRTLWLGLRFGR